MQQRRFFVWSEECEQELALRFFGNQHPAGIARDMAHHGLTERAIASKASALQLPKRRRSALVDHFDAEQARANLAAAKYVRRICPLTRRPWRG